MSIDLLIVAVNSLDPEAVEAALRQLEDEGGDINQLVVNGHGQVATIYDLATRKTSPTVLRIAAQIVRAGAKPAQSLVKGVCKA